MRILIVNKFFYARGGAETYTFALAQCLEQLGHEIAFFSMHHPQNNISPWNKYFVTQREYNKPTSAFRKVRDASAVVYSIEARDKFEQILEDFQPDIIHLNNIHRQITLSIFDASYLRKHHIPIVWTAHDYIMMCPAYTMIDSHGHICEDCIHGNVIHAITKSCVKHSLSKSVLAAAESIFIRLRKLYQHVDTIIAPSLFLQHKLQEAGFGKQTIHMQNMLSSEQIKHLSAFINYSKYTDTNPYIVFFGRLSAEKGVVNLVRAFAQYCKHDIDEDLDGKEFDKQLLRLRIIGTGPQLEEIKAYTKTLPVAIQQRIELLGFLTGDKLYTQIAHARYSVLSSQWYENMPYAGMESLACGTPILGADIGGIPELVIENQTGFTFDAWDTSALESSLKKAIQCNEQDYLGMQRQCIEYIQEHCDPIVYAKRIEQLYNQLLVQQMQ